MRLVHGGSRRRGHARARLHDRSARGNAREHDLGSSGQAAAVRHGAHLGHASGRLHGMPQVRRLRAAVALPVHGGLSRPLALPGPNGSDRRFQPPHNASVHALHPLRSMRARMRRPARCRRDRVPSGRRSKRLWFSASGRNIPQG